MVILNFFREKENLIYLIHNSFFMLCDQFLIGRFRKFFSFFHANLFVMNAEYELFTRQTTKIVTDIYYFQIFKFLF